MHMNLDIPCVNQSISASGAFGILEVEPPDLSYFWSNSAQFFFVSLLIANAYHPRIVKMRLLSAAALLVAIFTTNVIAGMAQLEAVLPACAVSSHTIIAVVSQSSSAKLT
jgi:hypothetical protein